MSEPAPFDVAQVMAEIQADARELSQRGDMAGFDRELDRLFAKFAPVGAVDEDFSAVLDKVEEAAFIDPTAPTASNLPGGAKVKGTVQRLVGWQLDYVLRQIAGFHHATVRAMRRLDQRLSALEETVGPGVVPVPLPPCVVDESWVALLTDVLGGVRGRVLHADAADGSLVERMTYAGIDAYGAEPSTDAALAAAARGVDVRNDTALDHLRSVPDDGLAGLVLSGCVDRLARPAQVTLAALAARKLAPGGVLVVLATEPDGWARSRSPVEVDLAPGRPLHPDTWRHLLEQGGLVVDPVRAGDDAGGYALVARRP